MCRRMCDDVCTADAWAVTKGEGLKEPVLRLPGVVSRKKQLIPELMLAEQE